MAENGGISAEQVKRLREMTGAGMMDCKRALSEAGGDVERAKDILRAKGMARAAGKASRTANEGMIASYLHGPGGSTPKLGVLVEVNCESDFVAKTDDFKELARELALQVAGGRPSWVRREEVPEDVLERERAVARAQVEGKPANIIDKIVEGKLEAFYGEHVLLDQVYVRDERRKKRVGELVTEAIARLGENITVARFARFEVGETGGNGADAPAES